MKAKVLAIIIAAILLVSTGIGIGLAIYANLPQNVAAGAIFGAVDDFGKRDEIKPILKTLTNGSLEFAVNRANKGEENLFEDAKLGGKIYFSRNALMVENLEVKNDDVSLLGDFYISEDLIYISEDEFIKNAYGVEFKNLAEDFKSSIFAYGSGSEYAIWDEDINDYLIRILNSISNEKMHKDAEKLVEKLCKKTWDIACDNFEFEVDNDEITIDGNKEKVRVITVVIDGDSLTEALWDFYDYLANDKSIPKFLDKYEDSLALEFNSNKKPSDEYKDYLEQLKKNIEASCDEIERSCDDDIYIRVVTPRSSKKLVKLEVKTKDTSVFTLDVGMKGIKKTNEIVLEYDGQRIIYQVKQDDSKEFKCVIKDGTNFVRFSIDKKTDKFTLEIDTPNNSSRTSLAFSGDWATKGGKTRIVIDTIKTSKYGYDDNYNFGELTETIDCEIVLTIDRSDKIPSAPKKYSRISDITDEDIKSWKENYDS